MDNSKHTFRTGHGGYAGAVPQVDEGLRAFMLSVYNHMAIGLLITGIAAFLTYSMAIITAADGGLVLTEFGSAIYTSPLKWVIMLAPLGFVFFLGAKVNSLQPSTARLVFYAFAVLMGVSLSSIFLIYSGNSITRVFFITAATFGGLSLYGYTTKKNLSGWGSFLIMGLIGIIIASVVNLFLQSTGLEFMISVLGVLIFAGLTAYDTQRIKAEYYVRNAQGVALGNVAIMGALTLYLDFINLFLMLLRLFGNRN